MIKGSVDHAQTNQAPCDRYHARFQNHRRLLRLWSAHVYG